MKGFLPRACAYIIVMLLMLAPLVGYGEEKAGPPEKSATEKIEETIENKFFDTLTANEKDLKKVWHDYLWSLYGWDCEVSLSRLRIQHAEDEMYTTHRAQLLCIVRDEETGQPVPAIPMLWVLITRWGYSFEKTLLDGSWFIHDRKLLDVPRKEPVEKQDKYKDTL